MQVRDGMSTMVLTVGPGHTLRQAARADGRARRRRRRRPRSRGAGPGHHHRARHPALDRRAARTPTPSTSPTTSPRELVFAAPGLVARAGRGGDGARRLPPPHRHRRGRGDRDPLGARRRALLDRRRRELRRRRRRRPSGPAASLRYPTTAAGASSVPRPCMAKIRSASAWRRRRRPARAESRAVDAVGGHRPAQSPRRQRHRRGRSLTPAAGSRARRRTRAATSARAGAGRRAPAGASTLPTPPRSSSAALEVEPGERSSPRRASRAAPAWQRCSSVSGGSPRVRADTARRRPRPRRPPSAPWPEPVDHGDQRAALVGREDREVARALLALRAPRPPRRARARRASASSDARVGARDHLTSVTVVPCPGAVSMSNSSTSRRAPGSPSPSPPPVV